MFDFAGLALLFLLCIITSSSHCLYNFQLLIYHPNHQVLNCVTEKKKQQGATFSNRVFLYPKVKDEKKIQEVVDLTDYERSEELRKAKSRSKKNHSKFTLLRSRQPGNTVSFVGLIHGRGPIVHSFATGKWGTSQKWKRCQRHF